MTSKDKSAKISEPTGDDEADIFNMAEKRQVMGM